MIHEVSLKLEDLPPQTLLTDLQKRKLQLEQVILNKTESLKNAPKGKLYISKSNGSFQFYLAGEKKERENTRKKCRYLNKSNGKMLQKLCQRDYDEMILERLKSEYASIEKLINLYTSEATFSICKMNYVQPVTLTDEKYKSLWQNIAFSKKQQLPEGDYFETSFGLKVRSKSELLIAEMLKQKCIPFRYEMKLSLKDFTVHPDFYCLNVRTRKEIVWEHFGLMNNEEYATNAVEKIYEYAASGYQLGKNFVATFETSKVPLNTKKVMKIIEDFLL